MTTAAATLVGSDISTRVIDQAIANAKLAGLQAWLDDGRLRFDAVDARVATPCGSERNDRLRIRPTASKAHHDRRRCRT